MQANVILCKCDNKHTFGIRVEKRGGDWVSTWAFKIDEAKAESEGYGKDKITGSFKPVDKYPGCPYCGGMRLNFCKCGGINCSSGESAPIDADGTVELTCNWCGETGYYSHVDTIETDAGKR